MASHAAIFSSNLPATRGVDDEFSLHEVSDRQGSRHMVLLSKNNCRLSHGQTKFSLPDGSLQLECEVALWHVVRHEHRSVFGSVCWSGPAVNVQTLHLFGWGGAAVEFLFVARFDARRPAGVRARVTFSAGSAE